MITERYPFEVTIVRTTVVRVSGAIDAPACERLDRILLDLIQNHGIVDLVVDLSGADELGPEIAAVLEAVQARAERGGGQLEIRVPSEPPAELVELAEDIPTFAPVETEIDPEES